jgi:hypothetical protein
MPSCSFWRAPPSAGEPRSGTRPGVQNLLNRRARRDFGARPRHVPRDGAIAEGDMSSGRIRPVTAQHADAPVRGAAPDLTCVVRRGSRQSKVHVRLSGLEKGPSFAGRGARWKSSAT